MAVEANAAALLLKMRRDGVIFGRVLTLGHQQLHHRRIVSFDHRAFHQRVDLGL